jgi:hypothetical protein
MGMAHFALHEAQDVLQRERADIEEEQQRLMEWGSLLKEHTTSERKRAAMKREHLDEVERFSIKSELPLVCSTPRPRS